MRGSSTFASKEDRLGGHRQEMQQPPEAENGFLFIYFAIYCQQINDRLVLQETEFRQQSERRGNSPFSEAPRKRRNPANTLILAH